MSIWLPLPGKIPRSTRCELESPDGRLVAVEFNHSTLCYEVWTAQLNAADHTKPTTLKHGQYDGSEEDITRVLNEAYGIFHRYTSPS